MPEYADFQRRSLAERDAFWREQATLIDWQTPFETVCDDSRPPFTRWFAGGRTNLCHNAVDRHVAVRGDQLALVAVSSETGQERRYTYAELQGEVVCMAAVLRSLGVTAGDRVLIYLPMIAEAAFAMLACARLGALHCVVFGGFAAGSLATRMADADPVLVIGADAGSRGGKVVPYKPLLDEALALHARQGGRMPQVLLIDRGLAPYESVAGRDHDYARARQLQRGAVVPCHWVDAADPSYILYTSGTTGRPKGVQRDTGGYAVALAASMRHIFDARAGQVFFCTSDIGWVVGHSYIIYAPLMAGLTTLMYEGLPTRPDAGVWWRLVERYRVSHMFSAPTAIRVLKKHDPALLRQYDLSSLQALFLAGEPLDEPTARWITDALGVPVIDNYWQTESGWPILTLAQGVQRQSGRLGSPGFAMYGYDVALYDADSGEELTEPGRKGVLAIKAPLPPGCLQTIWRDDARFVQTYWRSIPGQQVYSTFDYALRDADGHYFILGRTDDVLNVAGHRLGTREIEESISAHAEVAEVAVVGVADALRGQAAVAFVVPRQADAVADPQGCAKLAEAIGVLVTRDLGAVARPQAVHFVSALPKTRSGKLLRRVIQALYEGREPGDLSTLEDSAAVEQIRRLAASPEP